jgi:hypothetical protein
VHAHYRSEVARRSAHAAASDSGVHAESVDEMREVECADNGAAGRVEDQGGNLPCAKVRTSQLCYEAEIPAGLVRFDIASASTMMRFWQRR